MSTIYQSPVGAIFVEPASDGAIRLTVQQGRIYANLDISAGDLESIIERLRASVMT